MSQASVRFLTTIAALLLLPLHAQEPRNADEPEGPRRYSVEVIIFKYTENVGAGNEVFTAEPVEGLAEAFDELPQSEPEVSGEPLMEIEPTEPVTFEFALLDANDLTMTAEWGHLERLDVYDPVMHFGWVQSTHPEIITEARPLSTFVETPAGFDGEFKLYLERFLHLIVDVSLLADDGSPLPDLRASAEELSPYAPQMKPLSYRIREDRIFKSGDVRYFDHPKFGLLVRIDRVEDSQPESGIE